MNYEKHNMSNSVEYKAWEHMKHRCLNKNNKRYHNYGGRGITVCGRWLNSFENFYTDLGLRPSTKHSLDRSDNNRGYEPSNCKWATREEQDNNTSKTKMVELEGNSYTLLELSKKCGVSRKLLAKRIFERGWDIKRAIMNKSFSGSKPLKQA